MESSNVKETVIQNDSFLKFKVQRIIVLFSILIFSGKLFAYFITNSVGILTDALEGTVNVFTGFITLYSVYVSLKPRDANHPFGHGKIEFLSASIEGLLIIAAGLIIITEGIKRLFNPAEINQLDLGIAVVALAGVLNYMAGWYSIRVGKKNNSIALVSGGKHLQSDTYSSIGLVIGLVLLYFTKMAWLDSAIALIFGSIIIYTGYKILRETTSSLMDETDFKLISELGTIFEQNRSEDWIDIHNLKIVKYGSSYHITCDLVLPWFMNIAQSHAEGKRLEKLTLEKFSNELVFSLHTDECKKIFCQNCKNKSCKDRNQEFNSIIPFTIKHLTRELKTTN